MDRTEGMVFTNQERLKLFPVTRDWKYFNHAAVGPLPTYVLEQSMRYLEVASFQGGKHWERTALLMEDLRARLGIFLNGTTDEIAFTRNVSEGICFLATGLDWRPGDNVVLPRIEFPSNVFPWLNLERHGVTVRFVEPRNGAVLADDLLAAIDGRTRVLSLSSVQFYNGYLADLTRIGQECRRQGIVFCVDAIQHVGALPLDVQASSIDYLACGAHKWLMAGEGMGFVYCRKELAERLRPAEIGWQGINQGEDFFDFRLDFKTGARRLDTGVISAIGLYHLYGALSQVQTWGIETIAGKVTAIARRVWNHVAKRGWPAAAPQPTPEQKWVAGIITFDVPGKTAKDLIVPLTAQGFQVTVRQGKLRVSPHFYNTDEEVDGLFRALDAMI